MPTEVILPKVDMVMETGTFIEWLKQEGATVNKGEPLFVISTDKAAMEIESPATGTLCGLRAKPNDVIPVTSVLAYILAEGETLPATVKPVPESRGEAKESVSLAKATAAVTPQAAPVELVRGGNGKPRVTPVARRMAAELGIDLHTLDGRGPRGRIHKADILLVAQQRAQVKGALPVPAVSGPSASSPSVMTPPAPSIPLPDARRKGVVPLAGPRKIIAQRMAYSAANAPHITLTLSIDMTEASRVRDVLRQEFETAGLPLSFTAIISRAVAFVLTRHPYLNASLAGDDVVLWEDVHLGIATSLDDYLIVPVIRDAQKKNLREIAADLASLVERARTRKLTPAEMSGSTFTISNLGMYGIESFTSILNPPESAILSVGTIAEHQAPTAEGLALRPMMRVTACADHRVLDGVQVARFLADLKKTLENPYLLL